MAKKQTCSYTIYLLKSADQEAAIEARFVDTRQDIMVGEYVGRLYIDKKFARPPRWGRHFEPLGLSSDVFGELAAPGAALILDVDGRTFAVTFGTGRHILKQENIEERFGLLVVLNSINVDAIKSIDKKTIDTISKQTREQASREVDAQAFGLDIERDMLRAVTGTPADAALGQRLAGSDALKVTVRADLSDLPALIRSFHAKYKEKTYRDNFPWVDQITEVKSKAKQLELDELLINCIAERRFERCWLAAPDIIDWNVIAGFRYGFSVKRPLYSDLDFSDFLNSLREQAEVTRDTLERKVCCFGEDDALFETWSVYKCINCEIDDADGSAYLLSGGKWYRVTKDFVKDVNSFVDSLPRHGFAFPAYGHETEAEYNRIWLTWITSALSYAMLRTFLMGEEKAKLSSATSMIGSGCWFTSSAMADRAC